MPLRGHMEHSCLHVIPGTTSSFCLALIRASFLDILDSRKGLGERRECVGGRWGQAACGFTQWMTAFPGTSCWPGTGDRNSPKGLSRVTTHQEKALGHSVAFVFFYGKNFLWQLVRTPPYKLSVVLPSRQQNHKKTLRGLAMKLNTGAQREHLQSSPTMWGTLWGVFEGHSCLPCSVLES